MWNLLWVSNSNVLYFMLDTYCPIKGNEKVCSGDMLHFDLHKNGYDSVVEDKTLGVLNVTFRMVACDHKGNIIVKTAGVTQYYYSFVVMNHVIGLKKNIFHWIMKIGKD